MGRFRASYTAKEKLAAVAYAEAHGNRAAGREFGTNEKNVRLWRQQKDALLRQKKSQRSARGRAPMYPELEADLVKFVGERRERGIAVSTLEVHLQAMLLAKGRKETGAFTASQSWVHRFLQRHNLSIRRRTHLAQKLPEDFEDKIVDFQRFILNARKADNFLLSQMGNADQTPLTFDLPSAMTINVKGQRSVAINTTGSDKDRFTVMLACTADGGKLPPYVIFKRKTLPKTATWPQGIIIRCQEKGWMNAELMQDWVKCVWGKRPGGLLNRSLLVLDAFRAHRSPEMKEALSRDHRTTLAIIPGGMTSILQPLDVSINKPMKGILRHKWNEWYAGSDHTFTAGGRMRKARWIVEAWEEIDPDIIRRAFKKCCISNAMDGTEDDILFEEFVRGGCPTTAAADDDEEEDDDMIYTDRWPEMTQAEIEKFFESDDEGFEIEEI